MIINNIYFKQSEMNDSLLIPVLEDESGTEEDSDKRWARCRNCHNKIALLSDKISIEGKNLHIFKNPAGIFFRVVCFTNAPGSVIASDFTDEHTWFAGYRWSVSLCSSCYIHIGWLYSGQNEFYGLIADRLSGV